MEVSILEQLEWRVMPHPTLAGLLFSTGLLQGLPEACQELLQDSIIASYRNAHFNSTFVVLYQVYLPYALNK